MTAYTFLRVIVDHTGQIFNNLRQREVEFTATLMRDKVNRVMGTLVNLHVAICQKLMIFLLCIITTELLNFHWRLAWPVTQIEKVQCS